MRVGEIFSLGGNFGDRGYRDYDGYRDYGYDGGHHGYGHQGYSRGYHRRGYHGHRYRGGLLGISIRL